MSTETKRIQFKAEIYDLLDRIRLYTEELTTIKEGVLKSKIESKLIETKEQLRNAKESYFKFLANGEFKLN